MSAGTASSAATFGAGSALSECLGSRDPPGARNGGPGATLITRFGGFGGTTFSQFRGYELMIRSNGAWQIVASGPAAVTLASGQVAAARAYTLSLIPSGDHAFLPPLDALG
jgi:hypothetical protein